MGRKRKKRGKRTATTRRATPAPPSAVPSPHRGRALRLLFYAALGLALAALLILLLPRDESPEPAPEEPIEIPEIADLESLDARFAAAVTRTVAAIRHDPRNGALYGRLGQLYHAHKYFSAARQAYEIAGRLDSASADWPYYLAALATGRGDREIAIASLRRVLALDGDDLAARLRLANLLLAEGELAAAAEVYSDLAIRAPGRPWGLVGGAKVKRQLGELDAAAELLEQAVTHAPNDREGTYQLAMVYQELGRAEEAESLLEGLEEKSRAWPPDPRMTRIQQGRQDLQALIQQANRRLEAGDAQTAEALYREVLEHDPGHFDALFNLGIVLGRGGRYPEAQAALLAAIRSQPDHAQAHFVLAMAYAAQQQFENANNELATVLRLDPHHAEARALLAASPPS